MPDKRGGNRRSEMLLQISVMRLHGRVKAAKKVFLNTDLISAMNEVPARRVFVSRFSLQRETP
jgi:hypothetical protein